MPENLDSTKDLSVGDRIVIGLLVTGAILYIAVNIAVIYALCHFIARYW